MKVDHVVIGAFGEIGLPIFQLLQKAFGESCLPVDPPKGFDLALDASCVFLHVCIPGDLNNFNELVGEYIRKLCPMFVLIHSTVAVGTTSRLQKKFPNIQLFHCPVLGKHANNQMEADMLSYPKFWGGAKWNCRVEDCFRAAGWKPEWIGSSDNCELAKILQTSLFGYLIAWTQISEQLCLLAGADYAQVSRIWKLQSDDYNIQTKYPGIIGGHCVMQNLELLGQLIETDMAQMIKSANQSKIESCE